MENTDLEYLYHYTNVSSLAMILKNRNIRFSPLTVLDDIEEEKNQDLQKYAKWVFVSSWTDSAVESIPMWRMYTSQTDGVRIKLPKNPFCNYKLTINHFDKVNKMLPMSIEDMDIVIPPEEYIFSDYVLVNYHQNHLLHQVIYTDDNEKLYPQIKEVNDEEFTFTSSNLGLYKNTYWSFQNEWRYILYFLPIPLRTFLINPFRPDLRNIFTCIDLSFTYYYLNLDELKFKDLEITLSPQISDGNRLIVNLLVEKYAPTAKIVESELLGKIR
ncbi:MAG: DUF2971 domain-containing protein [Desulfitobacteriaceae bacterium]|nr:DUF2971 domain-containing protein [Desulfitobacteriaceae bacterium]